MLQLHLSPHLLTFSLLLINDGNELSQHHRPVPGLWDPGSSKGYCSWQFFTYRRIGQVMTLTIHHLRSGYNFGYVWVLADSLSKEERRSLMVLTSWTGIVNKGVDYWPVHDRFKMIMTMFHWDFDRTGWVNAMEQIYPMEPFSLSKGEGLA